MFKMKIAALAGALGLILSVLATPLMAMSFGIGVSGAGAYLEATGKETLKPDGATGVSDVTNHNLSNIFFMPSVYVQVTIGEEKFGDKNGFVLGIEHLPGSHQIGSKTTNKTDKLEIDSTTTGSNHAEAELSNHSTIYIESPGFTGLGLFLKAGYTEVTVQTNESLMTGSEYGDQTINATTLGGGFKGTHESGISLKLVYEYTDYDNISIASTGSDVASTVTADADTQAVKLSLGYNF